MFRNMQDYADEIDDSLQKKIISEISFSLEDQINELRQQYSETNKIFKVPKKFELDVDSSGDECATLDTFSHIKK